VLNRVVLVGRAVRKGLVGYVNGYGVARYVREVRVGKIRHVICRGSAGNVMTGFVCMVRQEPVRYVICSGLVGSVAWRGKGGLGGVRHVNRAGGARYVKRGGIGWKWIVI